MKNEQGINTPVVPVARLLRAVESQDALYDFGSTPSGIDGYSDWVAKGSPVGALIEVPIGSVVLDEAMQIRKKTDSNVVQKYADAIESGNLFPPITLACIDGVLVLVDGWHRLYARQSLREAKVVAFVTAMSYEEALCTSALANLANGIPLKRGEVKDAFHSFMQNYGYRQGHKYLSYREIAQKFGVHYTTIRNWVKKDYPRIFKRYQQDEMKGEYKDWDSVPGSPGKGPSKADLLALEVVKQAQTAMKNTTNMRESLCPESYSRKWCTG